MRAHARVCACTCVCVRAHVCRAAAAGAGAPGAGAHVCRAPDAVQECRAAGAAAGAGAGAGAGPSLLITVHLSTKHHFRQSRATPEPQNKYILNDTGTTPQDNKRYLPGMISERYGTNYLGTLQ